MIDLLSTFSLIEVIILLIIASILVILLAFVLLKIFSRTPFSITGKGMSISFMKETEKCREDIDKLKIIINEIPMIINKITELSNKQSIINYVDKIRESMNTSEDALIVVRQIREKDFLDELEKRMDVIDDITLQEDFKMYSFLIEIVSKSILDRLRILCRENGFNKMTSDEFSRYANNKIDIFLQIETDLLNDFYSGRRLIIRPELYKMSETSNHKVKEKYISMFNNLRAIAIKKEEIMLELMEEITAMSDRYAELMKKNDPS